MKKITDRFLALFLSAVILVSLAVPAAAVSVTGVSLNQHTLQMMPGQTTKLTADVEPIDASTATVTWKSNKPAVASVSTNGTVSAIKEGTATITVTTNDGGYVDTCTVTVVNNYVTDVEITPVGPGTLSIGESETLGAEVTYKFETDTDKGVNWSSTDTTVATVNNKGKVTGVSTGTCNIVATAKDSGNNNASVTDIYKLTVVDDRLQLSSTEISLQKGSNATLSYTINNKSLSTTAKAVWTSDNQNIAVVSDTGSVRAVSAGETYVRVSVNNVSVACKVTVTDASNDTLTVSSNKKAVYGGQYVQTVLTAPTYTIRNGNEDVSDNYNVVYDWRGCTFEGETTNTVASVRPDALQDLTAVCNITAYNKEDNSKVLTGDCTYTIRVLAGIEMSCRVSPSVARQALADTQIDNSTETVLSTLKNSVAGLTHVVFLIDQISGTGAGGLSIADGVSYYVNESAGANRFSDIVFAPAGTGTYVISFLAYGNETVYGQLTIRVTDDTSAAGTTNTGTTTGTTTTDPTATTTTAVTETRNCTSSGFSFNGSDFYRDADADPVIRVTFGTPTSGKLLRGYAHGGGTVDNGDVYYTDSANDGDYHVSSITYIPKAGYIGQAAIPMTRETRSGKKTEVLLLVTVTGKTASSYFTDVSADNVGSWAANAVDYAYDSGLVNGTDATTFAPGTVMTRAMLVTVLYRAAGSPVVAVTTNFRDLDDGAYYYNAVLWAAALGVVNGTSSTTFNPNDPLTREQLATILFRYASAMGEGDGYNKTLSGYADINSIDSYALQGMTWAVARGIITGTSDTTLSPLAQATRAQVVVMLHRYLTN